MKKLVLLASAFALCGCVNVSEVKPAADAFASLHGAHVTAVTFEKPDFTAMTYGTAAFGGLGGLAMITNGNKLVKTNNVPDPAIAISRRISSDLSQKLASSEPTILSDQDSRNNSESDLATSAGNKGVVLNVETTTWMFAYFPFDWTHYHVMYVARARLIDAASGKLIAQAPCTFDTKGDPSPPDYDTLTGNNASVLKSLLSKAADSCTATMETGLLGSAPATASSNAAQNPG